MSAIMSSCGTFRYRLEREVQDEGIVFAYFGVNGSTATATVDDHTVTKWTEFTRLNGGRRFIVGNAFGYRATRVQELRAVPDPIGPDNDMHLHQIIADADVLVPCWGRRTKLPSALRSRLDWLSDELFASGKPVKVWGFTATGDPLHPLTLAYRTALVDWNR